jgi:hypothetical protein
VISAAFTVTTKELKDNERELEKFEGFSLLWIEIDVALVVMRARGSQ